MAWATVSATGTPPGRWDVTDVNGLIRQQLRDRELANPHALSTYVLDAIPPEMYRDVLAVILPSQIKRVIQGQRGDSYRAIQGYRATATIREDVRRNGDAPNTYNYVWRDALSQLSEVLNERVYVDSIWKFLGECTIYDLGVMASALRTQAGQNVARAQMYEDLARQMTITGALTVAEMTE